MKKTKADYWAPRINAEWRKSVQGILNVGRQLIAAKEACEHGEFLRLFKGHENAVRGPVQFSANTAEILMKVAGHPVLSKPEIAQTLPQSWYTLYELTKLEDEQIVAGIKSGEIRPDMTRAEASALRADPVEKPVMPAHEQMADAVEATVAKFIGRLSSPQEFLYVRRRLERLLDFLREEETEHGSGRSRKKTARASAG